VTATAGNKEELAEEQVQIAVQQRIGGIHSELLQHV
jgi:hypothetical protein